MKISACLLIALVVTLLAPARLCAQGDPLDSRVTRLEERLNDRSGGAALFLFGAFCALWAQNTGRNPWLWFFAGIVFSVITVLVLLSKNSADRKHQEVQPSTKGST